MKLQNKKGFTLIELLVVITIIGILATGAVATYTSQIQKARDTTRTNDIKALQSGVEQFYQDDGAYPTFSSSDNDFGSGGVGKYVERFPTDSKTSQACNGGTPCDYLYAVGNDTNGVTNQNYNLSTGFENSGNVSSKADNEKDGGQMDLRLEVGVGLANIAAYTQTGAIAETVNSCDPTNDANYMLIRGNCD